MFEFHDKKILVVDDTESNLDILMNALGESYDIYVAMDAPAALEILDNTTPDLILLDVKMPGMDGFELCRYLKMNPFTSEIPVIFLTVMDQIGDKTRGFELGAVDYITKPFEIPEVKARVHNHLIIHEAKEILSHQNELLEKRVQERTRELQLTQDITIQTLAFLAETRDSETGCHIRRTQNYIRILSERLVSEGLYKDSLDTRTLDLLEKSATLHDIGKVGIPDNILMKPARLNEQEFDIMKQHTVLGKKAMQQAELDLGTNCFLKHAKKFAYSHHERWDGSGYPRQLAGEDIPIEGRLMAIADVYDALITTRIYKPPFSHSKACSIIQDGCGTHFDPVLVRIFEKSRDQFRQVALKHCHSEQEQQVLLQ